MPLTTTTIGAFPKPKSTPIQDWFLGTKTEEEKKASKGLLANWSPGAYEKALQEAGSNVEKLFLESIEQVVTDQVNAGIDVPTDRLIRARLVHNEPQQLAQKLQSQLPHPFRVKDQGLGRFFLSSSEIPLEVVILPSASALQACLSFDN